MSEAGFSTENTQDLRRTRDDDDSNNVKRVRLEKATDLTHSASSATQAALTAGGWSGSAVASAHKRQDATQASLAAATAAYVEARAGAEVKVCPYLDTINRRVRSN